MNRLPHIAVLFAAVLLVAADKKEEKVKGTKSKKSSGLALSVEVPGGRILSDHKPTVKLWLTNKTDKPMALVVPSLALSNIHSHLTDRRVYVGKKKYIHPRISGELYCKVKLLETHVNDDAFEVIEGEIEENEDQLKILGKFKLPSGHRKGLLLDLSGEMIWHEVGKNEILLPGRYSLSITYSAVGPDWAGEVTTQPVEFVVVEPEQQMEACTRRWLFPRIRRSR